MGILAYICTDLLSLLMCFAQTNAEGSKRTAPAAAFRAQSDGVEGGQPTASSSSVDGPFQFGFSEESASGLDPGSPTTALSLQHLLETSLAGPVASILAGSGGRAAFASWVEHLWNKNWLERRNICFGCEIESARLIAKDDSIMTVVRRSLDEVKSRGLYVAARLGRCSMRPATDV